MLGPGRHQWTGVPKAFTKDPFMPTMEVEKAKSENLKDFGVRRGPGQEGSAEKK